jgi:predicted dehydrogenase
MIMASDSGHAKLMVGHYMRYTSNVGVVKQLLDGKVIKNISRIECSFGNVFQWPSVSNFYERHEMSGGGILIDYGVHIFDLVCWLTGSEAKLLSYRVGDIVSTKIEKNVEVELELSGSISCNIRLSRTKKLPNTLHLEGDNGWMRLYLDNYQNIELCKRRTNARSNQEPLAIIGEKYDPYKRQLENFIESMIMDKTPPIPGSDGLRTLRLVESCYNLQNKG